MKNTERAITQEILEEAWSYDIFNEFVEERFAEGRTTNDDNSESMLNYTKLNLSRTGRWDNRARLSESLRSELREFPFPMTWLVITEGWCGDSAQVLPFLAKMASESPNITLKIILRDQYPDVMDQFLTNGARSIPKLVALESETLEVLGTWGPRPEEAQSRYMDERADPDIENKKASENLHLWYARDRGDTLQNEIRDLLETWQERAMAC